MHESQQIAAEKPHRSGAGHHGKEDHLTGHEISRQGLEHSNQAYLYPPPERQQTSAGLDTNIIAQEAPEQDIAALAYALWQDRRCPEGSPEKDWFRAVEELRSSR